MPRVSYSFSAISIGIIPQTPFGDPLPLPSNVTHGAGFVDVRVVQTLVLPL
jgi:hypothetical protein